ncbi:MAG: Hsp20/alpha crystallin family protein [Planctomycetales bacterium]
MRLLNRVSRYWDPWKDFQQLQQELNRAIQHPAQLFPAVSGGVPSVNVWRSEQGALLTSEIPGLDPEKLDISVNGQTVTVKGERTQVEKAANEKYHCQERFTSKFARTFQLPFRVDASKTEAKYEKGVLTVTLPQAQEDRPQKIELS